MKIYLNKKDRIIQKQEYMINKLKEENECLREQLEIYDTDNVYEKIKLSKDSYKHYMKLIKELEELKCEYDKLIIDVRKNNRW